MEARFEIDVRRHVSAGWEWRIVTFASGQMILRARGYAPFRWMARVDAWRCLRRNRTLLAYDADRAWLDGIDLR